MKKSILFSVLAVGATLLQAQSITVHQTCGQNGQVVKAIPPPPKTTATTMLGERQLPKRTTIGAPILTPTMVVTHLRSTIMKVAKPFSIRKTMQLTSIGAVVGVCRPWQNGRNSLTTALGRGLRKMG